MTATMTARMYGFPAFTNTNAFNLAAQEALGVAAAPVWNAGISSTLTPAAIDGPAAATYVASNGHSLLFTPTFATAYGQIAEMHRRKRVAAELLLTRVEPVHTNMRAALTQAGATEDELPHYLAGVGQLLTVAKAMQRLYHAQIGFDPTISSVPHQTAEDGALRNRYGHPFGLADRSPFCVADPTFPDRAGDGVVAAAFAATDLGKALTGFGNPFTAIVPDTNGRPSLAPYATHYAGYLAPAAHRLREAAAHFDRIDAEHALAAYLRAVADAFENPALFPFDAADIAWAAHGKSASRLFVRLGPDETGFNGVGDPQKRKALFHAAIGLPDPSCAALVKKYANMLPAWERRCAALIDDPSIYPAFAPVLQLPEFIQIALQTGDDIGGPHGTSIGQTLPNWGGPDGLGDPQRRVLIYTNKALAAYDPVRMAPYMRQLFHPDHHGDVGDDPSVGLENTVRHEIVHSAGPQTGRPRPDGTGDYRAPLKQWGYMFEELKAQSGDLFFAGEIFRDARDAYRSGLLDAATFGAVERWYRDSMMRGIQWMMAMVMRGTRKGNLRKSGAYSQLAGIQLGFLTEQGALAYDETAGTWRINYEKMPEATEVLMRQVLRLYARGDFDAVDAFTRRYLEGDGFRLLHHERIQAVMGTMPTVLFDYSVSGLT